MLGEVLRREAQDRRDEGEFLGEGLLEVPAVGVGRAETGVWGKDLQAVVERLEEVEDIRGRVVKDDRRAVIEERLVLGLREGEEVPEDLGVAFKLSTVHLERMPAGKQHYVTVGEPKRGGPRPRRLRVCGPVEEGR